MQRTRRSAGPASLVCVPPVLCLLLHWRSLHGWFQLDDFAWLGLLDLAGVNNTWAEIFFQPMAQGTIRPLSERAFFVVFRRLFDLDAFSYHAMAFATHILNLFLMAAVARRAAPRSCAWFWAPLFWTAHSAIAWPLAWVSAYNQILIATVFLTGILLLQRAARTGSRRDEALHWLAFLSGFAVLELNVVYPLLAAAYLLFCRPDSGALLKRILPMFPVSALYSLAHNYAAPKSGSGLYGIGVDERIASTAAHYLHCAFWPACSEAGMGITAAGTGFACGAALLLALLGFRLWPRSRFALFGLAWFGVCIAPYLLLPAKISLYYLAVPAAGLSIALGQLAGDGIESSSVVSRLAATCLLAAILPASWVNSLRLSAQYTEPGLRMELLVNGVRTIADAHPGKVILVEGLDDGIFFSGVYDRPFRLLRPATTVFLAPGTERSLRPPPDPAEGYGNYILDAGPAWHLLRSGGAVVYRWDNGEFRNRTSAFRFQLSHDPAAQAVPTRLDVSAPWFAGYLGDSWYVPEQGIRWMPKRARLRIGRPSSGSGTLIVSGYCVPEQIAAGPLHLGVSVNGRRLAWRPIETCDGILRLTYDLPACGGGSDALDVELEVDRTGSYGGDRRELGLAVVSVEAAPVAAWPN